MDSQARRRRIVQLLDQHQSATVEQLTAWLAASAATIRRDICWLADHDLIRRRHGRILRVDAQERPLALASPSFQTGLVSNVLSKRAIARYASKMCSNGDTMIINGGTTTYMMTEFLQREHLRIITNSFPIAQRLIHDTDNEVIISGGTVYRDQQVMLNRFDAQPDHPHKVSKMFTGMFGLSALGPMEADPTLKAAVQGLMKQAERIILLADSAKFKVQTGTLLCGLERVDTIITDSHASGSIIHWLADAGINIITVDPDTVPAHCPARRADATSPPSDVK